MKFAIRLALIAGVSVVAVSGAAAQESWVGKTIIMKKGGVKIGKTGDDGKQVFVGELTNVSYKVLGDKDGWLQANDGRGNTGWFDKADAVVLDDAVSYFTERIRQDGQDARAYSCRAWAWCLKGELDIAIKDYDEALRLSPQAAIFNNRGGIWVTKKDFDKAIADYSEAIRLDPKSAVRYDNRGTAQKGKKEYEKAIADYNEALRLDPKYGNAYNNRAWLLATCPNAKNRDGKKAVESAKQALELSPKDAGIMDTLAAAYAESGDFVEAVRWQERAMEDPQLKDNADVRRRLELYRDKKPYREE